MNVSNPCITHPQCLLGLLKYPLGPPLQGRARPGDGALGLFTFAPHYHRRWIRLSPLCFLSRAPWQHSHLDINTHTRNVHSLILTVEAFRGWGGVKAWGWCSTDAARGKDVRPGDPGLRVSPTASRSNMALIK